MTGAKPRPDLKLARLPDQPGVYRFYAADKSLLYVGKAVSLRKRVRSYFSNTGRLGPRQQMMVAGIASVEVTVTPTEGDALVLEHEQIKTLKPRFNVMFRDDKSYPYMKLTRHAAPRLAFHRGKPDGDCFGPYPSVWAVRESIRVLQRAFRLRTCTDSDFAKRTRPCLLHQIDLCSAPCVGAIDAEDYAADAATARRFLHGDDDGVVDELTAKMEEASQRQEFELAARSRDSIKALADIRHMSAVSGGAENADFIGVHLDRGSACVRLAAVRGGRLMGEIDFFPVNAEASDEADIVAAFVAQHYSRHTPPPRVVARTAVAAKDLAQLAGGGKTTFITRPQGNERERVAMAAANAANALELRRVAGAEVQDGVARLAELVGAGQLARIDCFDISHSMGEEAVASCVVFADGELQPRLYRLYRLKAVAGGDDYGGMRETLGRRYRKAAQDPSVLPDLVMVDGGAGQVSAAAETLAGLGGAAPVLGIAKGAERKPGAETLLTDAGEILELPPADPLFRLLQRIRDEAHRFAITGHRRRRDKRRRTSVLEDIEGVGPARRRELISRFGGLRGLQGASVADLSRIKGVGPELARRIYLAIRA